MKILLAYRCQYGGRNDFYTRQMPLGLGTINAVLRDAGFDSRLANFSRFTWSQVESALREIRPRILGISLFTFNRGAALKIAQVARKVDPSVFVVVGGPHATHLAERVLAHHPAVDAVAIGEGEETLLELKTTQQQMLQHPWARPAKARGIISYAASGSPGRPGPDPPPQCSLRKHRRGPVCSVRVSNHLQGMPGPVHFLLHPQVLGHAPEISKRGSRS